MVMLNNYATVISGVLKACLDSSSELPEQLGLLAKVYKVVTLQSYAGSVMAKYGFNQDKYTEATDALYVAAVKWYEMREYVRSYNTIVAGVLDLQPVSPLVAKLLTADIQSLGYFAAAAAMYKSYFEFTNDVDSLFYAGLCGYCAKNHADAVDNLNKFLFVVAKSKDLSFKYSTLCSRADKLLNSLDNIEPVL